MSDSLVRLALVGPVAETALKAELLRRVRNAQVAVVAESMQVALRDAGQFDAVVVDSCDDARCAAESGKHILVNVPYAESGEEAESLIEFCKAAGVLLAYSGLPRHAPASQAIINRLTSGKLGDPGLLRVHRWRSEAVRSLSSTIFGDVDLALHLFRARPSHIYAVGRRDHSYCQIHLGFPCGGMALLDFAGGISTDQAYDSLSLIGSQGAAYADDHHNTHLLFVAGNPIALISNSGNGCLFELRDFVECVARGISPTTDGDAILTVHRVTTAIGHALDSARVLHERGGLYEPA